MFWTIQNKQVLQTIQQTGRYYPDFRQSGYLKEIPALGPLYLQILRTMNRLNFIAADETHGNGVVFCFAGMDRENGAPLDDLDSFLTFINAHQNAVASLWKHLVVDPDNILLQVDFDPDFFNPMLIDINDFQFLMPPVTVGSPFAYKDVNEILDSLAAGKFHQSAMPSNVIQAHLPYIDQANLVNAYTLG